MGMVDLAERLGTPEELQDKLIDEAEQFAARYRLAVGTAACGAGVRLHRPLPRRGHRPCSSTTSDSPSTNSRCSPTVPIRAGFGLHVAVGDRRFHAQHLQELTGLDVGEGQARILLGDLHAYHVQLSREEGHDVDDSTAARLWVIEVLTTVRAAGTCRAQPHRHADPGVLRSTRSALASQRESRSRRRHQRSPGGADPSRHTRRCRHELAIAEVPTAPFAVLEMDDD